MARRKDKEKALQLRKKGMSYSQIKEKLGVSKSTLSYWLRDYPLPKERIRELRDWSEQRIERCRETKRKKKETRLSSFYREQKEEIFPLGKRDLFIAGLFLYWGEGTKTGSSTVSLSNTDPSTLLFFMQWLTKCFNVPVDKFKVKLHLYKDMSIKKETLYWSRLLNIPIARFRKPYIKNSKTTDMTYRRKFIHGTCNVIVEDARLLERILMSLKAISDHYMRL